MHTSKDELRNVQEMESHEVSLKSTASILGAWLDVFADESYLEAMLWTRGRYVTQTSELKIGLRCCVAEMKDFMRKGNITHQSEEMQRSSCIDTGQEVAKVQPHDERAEMLHHFGQYYELQCVELSSDVIELVSTC